MLRLCSCLTSSVELRDAAERELTGTLGQIVLRSPAYPFDTSDYYRDEMGAGLRRYWCCFGELFDAERLPEYRELTGRIEERLAESGHRRVNLDPGYLDHGKLVLASWKEAPDKIYLGRGVWAHTCLRYRDGVFSAPDHSFPDFKDGRFDRFMLDARRLYKTLLRQHGAGS